MRGRPGLVMAGALLAVGFARFLVSSQVDVAAQGGSAGVITGVVTGEKGPEAGVGSSPKRPTWPPSSGRFVVTNDQGKFLLPELPAANYSVWVRGYGLADSKPVPAKAGQDLKLTVTSAKSPHDAAQIYPASYWLSLMEPPKASEFPGTGPETSGGNGINTLFKTRTEWIDNMKACLRCHQVGTKWTREVPKGQYVSTAAAYDSRTRMGQRGDEMSSFMSRFGRPRGLQDVR